MVKLNAEQISASEMERMSGALAHRGPDDQGIYIKGNVGLGHRRLSILDLSANGHQPMTYENSGCWMVYNGEVYNYIEIREELKHLGYRFATETDTEVILAAWIEWGNKAFFRFNGMWALAIWEAPSENMVRYLAGCGLNVSVTEISGRKKVENVVPESAMSPGFVPSKKRAYIHPVDFLWKARSKIERVRCQRRFVRTSVSNRISVEHVDWDIDTVYDSILQHDIAIIPCDLRYDWDMAKSANRLTLFMALGMPVVASPVPAYCELAKQGESAIVARSPREWREAINWLSNAAIRKKMGQSARHSVWPHYSPENTVKKYIEVFQ